MRRRARQHDERQVSRLGSIAVQRGTESRSCSRMLPGAPLLCGRPTRTARISEIRTAVKQANLRDVRSVLTGDGHARWGMGGLDRLFAGCPLVRRESGA